MILRNIRFKDETWMEMVLGRITWRALVLVTKKILICCHSVGSWIIFLFQNLRLFQIFLPSLSEYAVSIERHCFIASSCAALPGVIWQCGENQDTDFWVGHHGPQKPGADFCYKLQFFSRRTM